MTQNTVFQYVKNIVLLSQKKLIFFTKFNLHIQYHRSYYNTVINCQLLTAFEYYSELVSQSDDQSLVVIITSSANPQSTV